ncbi:hypothetical protein BDN72DRAFT_840982 [Pluteus cervinus]|uniref:Uncharacterized protein n=1 Tax=Pluteus cervinus TaxID=181527 RepID=A0ACD3AUS0_9AGAR|nr:hypothetical protein BDN72DRAFT_840982 [Pluteus cervinus]
MEVELQSTPGGTVTSENVDCQLIHVHDLPNEVLHKIIKFYIPSAPTSLAEALEVQRLFFICRRWRAIVLLCVPEAQFEVFDDPWEMCITGFWKPREHQDGELKPPRLVLWLHPTYRRFARTQSELKLAPEAEALGPPYQTAFEVMDNLEVYFGSSLRLIAPLNDMPGPAPLKFLEIKTSSQAHAGCLFPNSHTTMFPHLIRLFMGRCLASPGEFANILHRMPRLEEFRIGIDDSDMPDMPNVYKFQSSSLVSLSISFSRNMRSCSWLATTSMPKLETLTCKATRPFQKALQFVPSSLRNFIPHVPGTCADRQGDLITFLEKCPQLEKLVIPTELLLLSPFFDKLSSGTIVANLKELQCGPTMLSADSLVGFLRKKGFVDAPHASSKFDVVSPTPTCAFSCVSFSGLSTGTQKEVEERLEGVTNVVEFIPYKPGGQGEIS